MNKFIGNTRLHLKQSLPTILTFIGSIGVVTTSVMAVKATPKAMKLLENATDEKGEKLTKSEIMMVGGLAYIPSIVIGVSTIACIFGVNVLNKKQQASLASAYALLQNYHKEYRNKLVDLQGKEIDIEVRNAMAREHCNYHQIDLDIPDEKAIFYDEISGESIVRYEREIMDAEYHLNRNFVMRGYATLNEFYEFLGLPTTDYGESIGWAMSDGYYWIDFEHRLISRDDGGTNIYSIDTVFPPDADALREWQ